MKPKPLSALAITRYQIPAHGGCPNTSVSRHPLLVYRAVFPSSASASSMESHLSSVGAVEPAWRYTMYSTSHFHSTTHEVLAVSHGSATLLFGGEGNAGKVEVRVAKGDLMVVPAGVAHRLWRDEEGGYEMVGSYPSESEHWDMCYGGGRENEQEVRERIGALKWFDKDPVYGDRGPVLEVEPA